MHTRTWASGSVDLSPEEIEAVLESPVRKVRAGALRSMDTQCRRERTRDSRRAELFDLYLRRIDRIDSRYLVDLAAPHVVGRFLIDKPRDILYELAGSDDVWERRSALVAARYLVRRGEVDDTFGLAEIALRTNDARSNRCTGSLLRAAGSVDRGRLLAFLDRHAATMPRITLRCAIEHLDDGLRAHYRSSRVSVTSRRRARNAGS